MSERERETTVPFIGGPADWRGRRVAMAASTSCHETRVEEHRGESPR
ncbi:hypothetical protein [Streptomonospora alba]|nr:hypothetical protein [Streptomonospora alba]